MYIIYIINAIYTHIYTYIYIAYIQYADFLGISIFQNLPEKTLAWKLYSRYIKQDCKANNLLNIEE